MLGCEKGIKIKKTKNTSNYGIIREIKEFLRKKNFSNKTQGFKVSFALRKTYELLQRKHYCAC